MNHGHDLTLFASGDSITAAKASLLAQIDGLMQITAASIASCRFLHD
jgi:hypothetical protein